MIRYFNAKDIYDDMRHKGELTPSDHSKEWEEWSEQLLKQLKEHEF